MNEDDINFKTELILSENKVNKKDIVVGVTGGNGFIGRKIVNKLYEEGIKVISLQKTNTSRSKCETRFFNLSRLETINEELLNGINIIVHTAGLVHKNNSKRELYKLMNTDATLKLYDLSNILEINKFIFLSTVGVYGKASHTSPIDIKFPTSPKNEYGYSKLQSENYLLNNMSKNKRPKISILRLPLVTGKNAPGNYGLLEKLSKTILPLPLGCANNNRTVISIEMLVDIVFQSCIDIELNQGLNLIGGNKPVSTKDLILNLKTDMGLQPKFISIPKSLIKFCLSIIGKKKIYEQLFEDLIFIDSTKNNKN